jgi:hypothetical protein
MADSVAFVRLPPSEVAPAYRESLGLMSHFAVTELGDRIVTVVPAEGSGAVEKLFEVRRLCDAKTDLADPNTWSAIKARPPRLRRMDDPVAYRDWSIKRAGEIVQDRHDDAAAQFTGFALMAMGAVEVGELDQLLQAQLPTLFERFPDGSLLYVTVEDRLLSRFAFARAQLAFSLTPDMETGPDMEQLKALSELTLTQGIDTTPLFNLPLLAYSPGVLGVVIPALPHSLVFCFGTAVDLRKPYPPSLSSIYRPRVLNDPEGLMRGALFENENSTDGERLVEWWAGRLNVLYSYIADPTRWTDQEGYHDPSAQTAWMVTFERVLGDALTLLAEPQATELDRVQMAFDLLDKAESLLGYGRDRSGKGFRALLRRSSALPRIKSSFDSMPEDIARRLGDETSRLFDDLYDQVRDNTLQSRLTPGGAKIARRDADGLQSIDNDSLVSGICRAVRNSSHGLLDILRAGDDRYLLAANTGGIPAELPALAPLIALALGADAERLVDGSWRDEL